MRREMSGINGNCGSGRSERFLETGRIDSRERIDTGR